MSYALSTHLLRKELLSMGHVGVGYLYNNNNNAMVLLVLLLPMVATCCKKRGEIESMTETAHMEMA